MAKDKVLVWDGCGVCKEMKDNGMCKKNECIEVTTAQGQKIAKQLGITTVPSRVCKDDKGNFKKCDMKNLYKKFSDK